MFKKRESVDILDLPELHRKKLINLPQSQEHQVTKITNDGFFDLSNTLENKTQEFTQKENPQSVTQTPEVKVETSQVTNFLSDFAVVGSNNPQITPSVEKETSEVKDIKWRLENLEFKLEQLIEKVNSINF